jgi:hypothetical protein
MNGAEQARLAKNLVDCALREVAEPPTIAEMLVHIFVHLLHLHCIDFVGSVFTACIVYRKMTNLT